MHELIRAAWVIARRDYIATVLSKSFILFLIGPLLPLVFGGIFSLVGVQGERQRPKPQMVAIADARTGQLLAAAERRLDMPGDMRIVPPSGALADQSRGLLADGASSVLAGDLDSPILIGPSGALDRAANDAAPLIAQARDARALERAGAAPADVPIARRAVQVAVSEPREVGADTARASQFVLVFLTMLLGGMLLSNLLEEKSNKVIEILAAAVPVDAIFLGKLMAMLAMSLTGILAWSALGASLFAVIHARGAWPPEFSLDTPAVGWPMFALLGLAYFTSSYLLLGAVFLGIGGQAKSAREVQTLSMPITMGQLFVFAFASAGIGAPNGKVAWAATVFPWSSPFEMFARAAQLPELWPHVIGLAWQAIWIALAIRIASGLFRRSVLNSAPFVGRTART